MTARVAPRRFRAKPRTMEALIVENTGLYDVEGYGTVTLSRGVYKVTPNVLIPLTEDQAQAFWDTYEEEPEPMPNGHHRTLWERLRAP